MLSKKEIFQLGTSQGLIPPFNHKDEQAAKKILDAVYAGGLRIIEFTNRSENALPVFKALVKHAEKNLPGLVLGIGTIMNEKQAKQFYKAGAQFIVSPVTDKGTGEFCVKNKLFWMPGAGTATEIINATDMGADLIKVFPAEVLGPAFVKAVKAPCPWTKLMASGGVTFDEDNLRQWFNAGVDCVAMGSNLFSKEVMQEGNYTLLAERIKWLLNTIAAVRK
ncbi:MAG: bifunctional 4-hydroxy-2-oxoglutarate aldolase/2-dehydro-3-deoxy-phosphogluconate aldolase [Chitinophagaceae bacterium]